MISANHPRLSCTSDMSLTIYGKIFSGPLVHTNDPSGTGVYVSVCILKVEKLQKRKAIPGRRETIHERSMRHRDRE